MEMIMKTWTEKDWNKISSDNSTKFRKEIFIEISGKDTKERQRFAAEIFKRIEDNLTASKGKMECRGKLI